MFHRVPALPSFYQQDFMQSAGKIDFARMLRPFPTGFWYAIHNAHRRHRHWPIYIRAIIVQWSCKVIWKIFEHCMYAKDDSFCFLMKITDLSSYFFFLKFEDRLLVSASYDKTLRVWNMNNGECLRTLRGHNASIICMQMRDRVAISGSSDSFIKVHFRNT